MDRDDNKAALNLGVWTGKGSFTLPYSKYKVMYPELLGRVGPRLTLFCRLSRVILTSDRIRLQWALEMKTLSVRPGYGEQWRGSIAVFIDSGSSSVNQNMRFTNLEMPVLILCSLVFPPSAVVRSSRSSPNR